MHTLRTTLSQKLLLQVGKRAVRPDVAAVRVLDDESKTCCVLAATTSSQPQQGRSLLVTLLLSMTLVGGVRADRPALAVGGCKHNARREEGDQVVDKAAVVGVMQIPTVPEVYRRADTKLRLPRLAAEAPRAAPELDHVDGGSWTARVGLHECAGRAGTHDWKATGRVELLVDVLVDVPGVSRGEGVVHIVDVEVFRPRLVDARLSSWCRLRGR